MIKLRPAGPRDVRFLYNMLKERKAWQNISHVKMPSYQEHQEFWVNSPYKKTCIIMDKQSKVGYIYLSFRNEIGIFIKETKQLEGYGKTALRGFMSDFPKGTYYANISPYNDGSQTFFSFMGFEPLQYTYKKVIE